ncbi:F-box protein At5g07610-like [Rutidosis leptorrhynchoides]|uniref:F-box protein At5g07610-like n=1 Tax=Rutidosis leptorrhynchoides TaxID=125765 RepID=UPI003A99F22A
MYNYTSVGSTKRRRLNNKSDVVSVVTNGSFSSSHDKVCSCEYLVEQILLRLPVISLLRFKSVSKHWYSLISDSRFQFLRTTRTIDPPSSLYAVVCKTNTMTRDHFIVPLDDVKKNGAAKAPYVTLNFDPTDYGTVIVHSCNGIMLVSQNLTNPFGVNRYVYNPTINQFIVLPKHEPFNSKFHCAITLAFDPSKSPYYKIVSICGFGPNYYRIGIYSSQTCTWKASCNFNSNIDRFYGVYWNNAVHWLDKTGLFLYFNLDEEIVREMHTSFCSLGTEHMFESRDHLLLVEADIPSKVVKIHELKRDYSGWFVKYHIELDQLGRSFPKLAEYKFRVLSIVLDEKEEDESFFVLAIGRVAIRFNLVANTFYQLYYFNASYNYGEMFINRFPDTQQFIPSLYKV